jgi:hypothetical protein
LLRRPQGAARCWRCAFCPASTCWRRAGGGEEDLRGEGRDDGRRRVHQWRPNSRRQLASNAELDLSNYESHGCLAHSSSLPRYSDGLGAGGSSHRIRRSRRPSEVRIARNVLARPDQGEIDAVPAIIAGWERSVAMDEDFVRCHMVIGVHNAVNAGLRHVLAGPIRVRGHGFDLSRAVSDGPRSVGSNPSLALYSLQDAENRARGRSFSASLVLVYPLLTGLHLHPRDPGRRPELRNLFHNPLVPGIET